MRRVLLLMGTQRFAHLYLAGTATQSVDALAPSAHLLPQRGSGFIREYPNRQNLLG